MKKHLQSLKTELKVLAAQIKEYKQQSCSLTSNIDKTYKDRHNYNVWKTLHLDKEYIEADKAYCSSLSKLKYPYLEYRSKHIAYCLLRGRTMEQIEPKLRDPNEYNYRGVREKAYKIVEEINAKVIRTSAE